MEERIEKEKELERNYFMSDVGVSVENCSSSRSFWYKDFSEEIENNGSGVLERAEGNKKFLGKLDLTMLKQFINSLYERAK